MSHQKPNHRYLLQRQETSQQQRLLSILPSSQNQSTQQQLNIFQVQSSQLGNINLGPQFDQNGLVVKRSIIGLAAAFAKQLLQRTRVKTPAQQTKINSGEITKRNYQKLASQEKIDLALVKKFHNQPFVPPDNSISTAKLAVEALIKSQQLLNLKHYNYKKTNSIDPNILNVFPISTTNKSPKKSRAKPIAFTKQILLQQMIEVRQQLDINQVKEGLAISQLGPASERIMTRDYRSYSKFNEQVEDWDNRAIALGQRSGRQAEETLFQKSAQYREKVEQQMISDAKCEEGVKIQTGYWYGDLRNYSHVNQVRAPFQSFLNKKQSLPMISQNQELESKSLVQANYNSKFQTNYVVHPNKQFEMVRSNYSKTIQSSRMLQSQLKSLAPSNYDQEQSRQQTNENIDLQDLKLEGINIFYKELENLRNDGQSLVQVYNHFKVQDEPLNDQETIVEDQFLPKIGTITNKQRRYKSVH